MGRYEFSLNANIKAKDGICPCYGCEGRSAGCHSKCEKFTIWNQKHLKNKKEMQNKAFIENQAVTERTNTLEERGTSRNE